MHRIRTLEPGKLADLILVKGRSLRKIESLINQENMSMVMKDGVIEVDKVNR